MKKFVTLCSAILVLGAGTLLAGEAPVQKDQKTVKKACCAKAAGSGAASTSAKCPKGAAGKKCCRTGKTSGQQGKRCCAAKKSAARGTSGKVSCPAAAAPKGNDARGGCPYKKKAAAGAAVKS